MTQTNIIDNVVHASQLIDPEDRIINSAINVKGYYVRVSISQPVDLLVEDWLERFESWVDKCHLRSFDTRIDKEDKRRYFGTIIYEVQDCIAVLFLSSGEQTFFHFWSNSFEVSDNWCRRVEAELFLTKIKNVFDEATNTRDITFWGQIGSDYTAFNRKVVLLPWEGTVPFNYPPRTLANLEILKNLKPPIHGGKILLLHGGVGTGKTSLLRSLSHHWTKWCHTSYITDPESFLGYSGSMLKVITWEYDSYIDEEVDAKNSYHMLIIEDADELISADAKSRTSQGALGRLLNIGDGLLGQSTKLLICITTNVDMRELHPAVARPGRCLAQIQFDSFSYEEACAWLTQFDENIDVKKVLKNKHYSLAELYEVVGTMKQIAYKTPELVQAGQYL